MALDPLATVDDLEARGFTVEASETDVATTYLGVASAAVREAAGVPISRTTSTVTLEGTSGQWLRLPGPPIASVASVSIDGVAVTDWLLRSERLWRAVGWTGCEPSEVEVTQTHGLLEVPEDIVDLVCRMTASAIVASRDGTALATTKEVTSERLGDWSVTYGADGRISEMDLPQYWRERLQARFGGGVSMLVFR
ncbi:hypothetical protein [Streptomyces chartreusis]|uniref:hypothetical protein n=1 Tax=Streptomyces chartreusis TaxID=1969 RepID=UPI0037FF18D8